MSRATASANASTVTRSRIFVMLGVVPRRKVGEKVERAGDEDRAVLARAGERRGRIRLDLDLGEVRPREACELSAGSARAFDDWVATKRPPAARVSPASRRRPCRAGSRRRACSRRGRAARRASARAVGVVRAVAELVAPPLEPAGKRDLDLALDGRPRNASAASRAPPSDDVRPGEVRELLVREGRRSSPPARPRASRPRSPRASPRARRCARARRSSSRTTCDRSDVRRVEPAAEARPRRPRRRPRARRTRRMRRRRSPRTASPPAPRPRAGRARPRPRSRPPRRRP